MISLVKKDYDSTKIYRKTHKKGASQTYDTPSSNKSKYLYYSVLNLNLLLISFRWVYKSRFFISFLL